MEKTQKQEKQWEEFKDDLLGSMDSEYNELRRILNTKTKYVETKTMNKCLKLIRNIIHSHKVLMRDSSYINNASLGGEDE